MRAIIANSKVSRKMQYFIMKNKPYFLALNRIPRVGPRMVLKLLAKWPDLSELFHSPTPDLENAGLPANLAKAITTFDFSQTEKDLRWAQLERNTLLTWGDPAYPPLLKEIYDPPLVLYASGDLSCLHQPTVAMVGSRKPTLTGSETAWCFASELAAKKITIVSGLALGIDAQAHQGCLHVDGKTIAVLGSGIDQIYPYRHQNLAEKISVSGLLLSEFPLGTPPMAGHFPRRNRIISGLSLITLVVEAATCSGSLITARLALEQNRDVLAVPSSIYNPQARGCHHLLQQGAKLVTSVEDVLNELCVDYTQTKILETMQKFGGEGDGLLTYIGFEVTAVDQIVERSGLSIDQVICDLADLELQGFIKAVPGGYLRYTL